MSQGAGVPTTHAGVVVWRLLRAIDRRPGFGLLIHPVAGPELLFQVSALALRRRFGRDADDQAACAYVTAVAASEGRQIGESAAAALVEAMLHGGRPDRNRVSRADRMVVLSVLSDLVRSDYASPEESAELARAGEVRLARLRRKTGRRRGARRRPDGRTEGRPTSLIGQILQAQSAYDHERLRALPDEQSTEAVDAVVNAASAIALSERFGRTPTEAAFAGFARRMARTSQNPLLDAALAASIVTADVTGRPVDEDVHPDLLLHARLRAFVHAVDDLGFYEREVDDIIVEAERIAEATGFRLTPADQS